MSLAAADKLPRPATVYALLALVAVGLLAIRLTGRPDLMDSDQERPAAYVLDVVINGHWLCQRDVTGDITSKPPLYTWLAALATIPVGRISRFTLVLPSALAVLLIGWLIFRTGAARFGWAAGWLGALGFLLSGATLKQVALARTDPLFALTVTVAALAALHAWQAGRGWTWFWLAAAAATLTKGPLGLVLAAAGLLAAVWEWPRGARRPRPPVAAAARRTATGRMSAATGGRGLLLSHGLGVVLFLLITGGWFALAYAQMGQPLIDKMIGKELVGHIAIEGGNGTVNGQHWFKPFLYFLLRFVPWSLIACLGFWRVVWRPAPAPGERRGERFLFCWFWIGLLIFSIPRHQRGDLLFPLFPPVALLAGRELARWLGALKPATVRRGAMVATVLSLGFLTVYERRCAARNLFVGRSVGIKQLAGSLAARVGDEFPLTHVDDPFALQFYLNTVRPAVSFPRAAGLLRGEAAAFVVVDNFERLQASLGPAGPSLHELARWPATGRALVRIVSNHPRLEWTAPMAMLYGPLRVHTEGVRLEKTRGPELVFAAQGAGGEVAVTNDSDQPQPVRLRITGGQRERLEQRLLAPHNVLHVVIPGHQPGGSRAGSG